MKMKKTTAAALAAVLALSLTGCGTPNESKSAGTSQTGGKTEKRASMFDFLPPIDKPNSEDEFICEVDGIGVKITGTTAQGTALWIPDKIYDKPVLGVNLPNADFEEIIMPDTVQIFSLNYAKVKYTNVPRNIQYDRSPDGYDMPESNEMVLEAVYFDDGISEIMAMTVGKSLKKVSLPDSLTTLGSSAFATCSGLTQLDIPEGVKSISPDAFEGCTSLVASYKGKTYDYENFDSLYDAVNFGKNGMLIEDGVLKKVSRDLTEIVIPDDVTIIGEGAFENCENLTSVTIPESVITIKDYTLISRKDIVINCKSDVYDTIMAVTSADMTAKSIKSTIDNSLTDADANGYGMKLKKEYRTTITCSVDSSGAWTVNVGDPDMFKTRATDSGDIAWSGSATVKAGGTYDQYNATAIFAKMLADAFPEMTNVSICAYCVGGKNCVFVAYTEDTSDISVLKSAIANNNLIDTNTYNVPNTSKWNGQLSGKTADGLIIGTSPQIGLE